MAPLTNEPDALRVVLNLARRKAFYTLVCETVKYMRSQLELPHSVPVSHPSSSTARRSSPPPPYSETDDAPLFVLRNNQPQHQSQSQSNDGDDPAPPPKPPRPKQVPPSPALVRLRKAALSHFDAWRTETLGKLREVVSKADDPKVLEARRQRAEQLATRQRDEPADGEDLLSFDTADADATAADPNPDMQVGPNSLSNFQTLYHPIPTRLASIPLEDRKEVLSAMLILLLSIGNYSAYSRALVCYLASALEIPPSFLNSEETEIATTMVEAAQKADAEKQKSGMSAEAEAQKRKEQGQVSRFLKVGLASVAGAAIIGVTGGLAAPAVAGVIGGLMGSVGLGGLASFLGIFWMNGALVGTIFGAFGAKMTGGIVDQYAKEVEDFKFLPLKKEWGEGWSKDGPEARRLRVTIGINGWLTNEQDVTKPWRALGDESEVFALRYEMNTLMSLGNKLKGLVTSAAWSAVRAEILQRTVLATLQGALWPIFLLSSASNIDNPFSLARNRSEKAGQILADALINRVQGERPVTLVGYSLGARVIYSCLRVLADRKAFGLVDTVVLIGAPVPSNAGHWQMMRTMVSGKVFNVYSENDYILAFLYRTTSMQLGIAGLQAISDEVDGVENLDLSAEVTGHLRYPDLIARILTRCGFPNVKGGEHEIEKDDGEIILQNKGWGETGTLVDLNDPNTMEPSRHSTREMENEKFDLRMKKYQEQKSVPAVKDAEQVSFEAVGEHKSNASTSIPRSTDTIPTSAPRSVAPTTTPMPTLSETPWASTSRSIGISQAEVPMSTGRSPGVPDDDDGFDYDSDADEYGGGIKMMDNDTDTELTFVEPLSIQD